VGFSAPVSGGSINLI